MSPRPSVVLEPLLHHNNTDTFDQKQQTNCRTQLNAVLYPFSSSAHLPPTEMPIKLESSYMDMSPSPSCFSSDELDCCGGGPGGVDHEYTAVTSPCEDIWNKFDDFLLTPPQSPPIKFDLVSDTFDQETPHIFPGANSQVLAAVAAAEDLVLNSCSHENGFYNHNIDVLHDCMWSGQCNEDSNNNGSVKGLFSMCSFNGKGELPTAKCNMQMKNSSSPSALQHQQQQQHHHNHNSLVRPDTPLLSASPLSLTSCSFTDILSSCHTDSHVGDHKVDHHEEMEEEQQEGSSPPTRIITNTVRKSYESTTNNNSLINDHSYGTVHSSNSSNKASSSRPCVRMQSLICSSQTSKYKIKKREKINVKHQKYTPSELRLESPPITVKFLKQQRCISSKVNGNNGEVMCRKIKLSHAKRASIAKSLSKKCLKKIMKQKQKSQIILKSNGHVKDEYEDEDVDDIDDMDDIEDDYEDGSLICSPGKGSKSMYPERRKEHNDSERKRRDHLRDAFHCLRDQIPKLKESQKKPARIQILHEATTFVETLQDKQRYLEKTKQAELRKRDELLKRMNLLQQQQPDCTY